MAVEAAASGRPADTGPHSHGRVRGGRDLRSSSGPNPCSEQRHVRLDQVAQSSVQPGPEYYHGWGVCPLHLWVTCSRAFTTLIVKNFLLQLI